MSDAMDRMVKAMVDASATWAETPDGRRMSALLRGEPVPAGLELPRSPLPTGENAAERYLIEEILPQQASAYLARRDREAEPPPSPESIAFAEKLLGWES